MNKRYIDLYSGENVLLHRSRSLGGPNRSDLLGNHTYFVQQICLRDCYTHPKSPHDMHVLELGVDQVVVVDELGVAVRWRPQFG